MSQYKNCRIVFEESINDNINNQCLRCKKWSKKLKGEKCFKASTDKKKMGCLNYEKSKDFSVVNSKRHKGEFTL